MSTRIQELCTAIRALACEISDATVMFDGNSLLPKLLRTQALLIMRYADLLEETAAMLSADSETASA